jgi:hypothetical protein
MQRAVNAIDLVGKISRDLSSFSKLQKLAGFLSTTANVPVVLFNTCFYSQSFVLAVDPKFQQIQAALCRNWYVGSGDKYPGALLEF